MRGRQFNARLADILTSRPWRWISLIHASWSSPRLSLLIKPIRTFTRSYSNPLRQVIGFDGLSSEDNGTIANRFLAIQRSSGLHDYLGSRSIWGRVVIKKQHLFLHIRWIQYNTIRWTWFDFLLGWSLLFPKSSDIDRRWTLTIFWGSGLVPASYRPVNFTECEF